MKVVKTNKKSFPSKFKKYVLDPIKGNNPVLKLQVKFKIKDATERDIEEIWDTMDIDEPMNKSIKFDDMIIIEIDYSHQSTWPKSLKFQRKLNK
jgi:hypothetical protein